MDREIKYRGLSVKEKQWVYGLPSYGSGGGINNISGWMGDDGAEQYQTVEVIENTVGQFTGLLDKNKKEIYEGDVLKLFINDVHIGSNEEITFKSGSFWLNRRNISIADWYEESDREFEVVGNIYEKNLLTTK